MKVTLVSPLAHTKYSQPPMGLALLGAVLEGKGHKVRIIDRAISKEDILWLIDKNVDVIGFTAMTPDINAVKSIIGYLRLWLKRPKVILGGVHASVLPEETLSDGIDVLVKGEGDNAIVEALNGGIKGIYESPNPVDIDALPYLAYHLLSWDRYIPHPPHGRALPWLAMITSRGCPYSCTFCAGSVFGKKYRAQSPVRVVDEIAYYIKRFGVREIAFYDDVFTLDRERALGICNEILRRNIKVCWTCETRVNLVDYELLKYMKRAGCYSISYGIESGSQAVLNAMNKGITIKECERAVKLTREEGIQTVGYFMIGSPNETAGTVRKTIDFAKRLRLDCAQFSVVIPFPGTKLYAQRDIPWDKYVYAGIEGKTRVFVSTFMSSDDVQKWVHRAYREFYLRPAYVCQRLWKMKSWGDVKVGINGLKMLVDA